MKYVFLNALHTQPLEYFWSRTGRSMRDEFAKVPDDVDTWRNPYAVMRSVLISYVYWAKYPHPKPTEFVFGDSGGFTIVTANLSVDPERVIRWQMRETQAGPILDIPPYRGQATSARFSGNSSALWEESLARTLNNVRRALPYYQDDPSHPFKWWGVVQGDSYAKMEEWHGKVSEIYPFEKEGEGWALKPHPPNDLAALARCIRFAGDKGIKRIHLFQTTGPRAVALLFALGEQAGIDLVMFDSESAARMAITRTAFLRPEPGLPIHLQPMTESSRDGETRVRDYVLNCPCQACRWYRADGQGPGDEYSHYLLLHNYIVMHDAFVVLKEAANAEPMKVLRAAAGQQYGNVMRAFDGKTHEPCGGAKTSVFDRI